MGGETVNSQTVYFSTPSASFQANNLFITKRIGSEISAAIRHQLHNDRISPPEISGTYPAGMLQAGKIENTLRIN